ncbi:MAG: zinc-dependent alcohol dehydrogenase [Acidimicrobiales bacterium]
MRAFVVTEPGLSAVQDWPNPGVVAGEVLVRTVLVGMCGTDLELIDGALDPAYVRYPLVLGHEWVGKLVSDSDVGPANASVVVEGVIPCGQCGECRRGASNLCATYDEVGFTRAGAIADLISVPSFLVHRLNSDVDPSDAVLVEPMAVVWRALTRLPLRSGLRVAIVGDGTIALLATYLVGLFKPSHVIVIAQRAEQRELAFRAGAHEFVTELPVGKFDLIIEAAGNATAVTSALGLGARGAMVVLLGLPPHGTRVEIAPDDLVNNDVIIQASFSYTRTSFAEVVELLNSKKLQPSFLITHRFTVNDASFAVATLRGGSAIGPRGKVIVEVSV